ncbi:MAG: hypothetical protein IT514_11255 [Burkholderiales bacterium]|nr:hypothetical protein [Burkholderiales bacterium]
MRAKIEGKRLAGAALQFVRHNAENETVACAIVGEREAMARIERDSRNARLTPSGDEVLVG